MSNESPKTILLFNHVTGTGHHESWTAIFASLLLARGFRVVCVTPDPLLIQAILPGRAAVDDRNLAFIASPELFAPPPSWVQRLKSAVLTGLNHICTAFHGSRRIQTLAAEGVSRAQRHEPSWIAKIGILFVVNIPRLQITGEMPPFLRWKRRILQVVVLPLWCVAQVPLAPWRLIRHWTGSSLHGGFLHPVTVTNAINRTISMCPWRPDFLLLMYQDLLMTKPGLWKGEAASFPIPWGGVRFMPFSVENSGKEGYFRQAQFRGMCFLDEHAVSAYTAADPDRAFVFLPDVTNTDSPAQPPELAMEIRRRAAGRKVVLLCGSIEGRKNVGAFCQLALKADPARWYFAMVGQLHSHTFSQQDQDAIAHFIDAQEGNTFYSDTFFPDERDMNAVIQVADILFAAYRNFPISSNMLGKAAHFAKAILVSDGFLMGDRVRRYGIGVVVNQDDVQDMLGGLERLAKNPVASNHFAVYRAEFSEQKVSDSLGKFLSQALATQYRCGTEWAYKERTSVQR